MGEFSKKVALKRHEDAKPDKYYNFLINLQTA